MTKSDSQFQSVTAAVASVPPTCFRIHAADGVSSRELQVRNAIIAGWAGRDLAAVEAHIAELEEIGVARPSKTPLFYRVAASLVTTSGAMQVVGGASSGEAEATIVHFGDLLCVGIGSDHTDREVEAYGVTVSKQVCAKPLGPDLWLLDDVLPHWDQLVLRSFVTVDGVRRLYQEGPVSGLRHPLELVDLYRAEGGVFEQGCVMLCGTMPVHGGFQPSGVFELELADPVLGRTLRHTYTVEELAIAG